MTNEPGLVPLQGRHVCLEPLDWSRHGGGLAHALLGPENHDLWTYIPFGPDKDLASFREAFTARIESQNWRPMVLIDPHSAQVLGMASYMRLRPPHGSAEVGCIVFSKALQRSRAATEAMALMAAHIFDDLGYRRYEWKCDTRNEASKRAALRLGFLFEGIFRKDLIVKGRNRDTAWFAMTDDDWPAIKAGFEHWLADSNFDAQGRQIRTLKTCRETNTL